MGMRSQGMTRIGAVLVAFVAASCGPKVMNPVAAPAASRPAPPPEAPAIEEGAGDELASFEQDLAFLQRHGPVIVLKASHGGVVAVSPKYQGRVMTSAVHRGAASLGYLNRGFIEAGETGTAFDNYGGEDRFWLGPEGGQYGLYFAPGDPFDFDHWQTPAAFQQGVWSVSAQDERSVTFVRPMTVRNHAGSEFQLTVTRTVRLLDEAAVLALWSGSVPDLDGVEWVAFETENVIRNDGDKAWTKEDGLISIWILGMYEPSPDTWVVLRFDKNAEGPIVRDDYFGKVPSDRLVVEDTGYLRFKCDGEHRSKIGVPPERAEELVGSYSASSRLLTVVHYDQPDEAEEYVNSKWEEQDEPYAGDVINSYNDGPVEPGKPALGGFYEIETSSPAAALGPGESLTHVHRTLHFVGDPDQLDLLAQASFAVTLDEIRGK